MGESKRTTEETQAPSQRPAAPPSAPAAETDPTRGRIMAALDGIYDPCCAEKQISVVDMGLIDNLEVDGSTAKVDLVLTSGWCPFSVDLLGTVKEAVESVPEIEEASVEVHWDKAWATDRLSPSAKAKLRFLPEPNEVGDRSEYLRMVAEGVPNPKGAA
jgi:metal-sulfur cluster biosynthetic enzyme